MRTIRPSRARHSSRTNFVVVVMKLIMAKYRGRNLEGILLVECQTSSVERSSIRVEGRTIRPVQRRAWGIRVEHRRRARLRLSTIERTGETIDGKITSLQGHMYSTSVGSIKCRPEQSARQVSVGDMPRCDCHSSTTVLSRLVLSSISISVSLGILHEAW